MDWTSIVIGAACGAVGGAIGGVLSWLLSGLFRSQTAKTTTTTIVAVVCGLLGYRLLSPWAQIEYAFATTPDLQKLAELAPDHIDELKATLRDIVSHRGGQAEAQRAGYEWGRKYIGAAPILRLFASPDDATAVKALHDYNEILVAVNAHNPSTCFAWFEGTRPLTADELGIDGAHATLLKDLLLRGNAQRAVGASEPIDESLVAKLRAAITKNWDPAKIDLEALGNPNAQLPPERQAKVCYTAAAMFSELQLMPADERRHLLRGMYGQETPADPSNR